MPKQIAKSIGVNDKKINFLFEEKKLMNNVVLDITRTLKQTLGILIPLIALALSQSRNAPEVFIILPFIIIAFVHFLLATLNSHNIIYAYLESLEETIASKTFSEFPFFQMSVGKWITNWGINITSGKGFTPNPHYSMGIAFAVVILSAYVYCVYNGFHYLESLGYRFSAKFFVFLSSLMMLFLLVSGVSYALRFRKVKEYAKSQAILK